MIKIEAVHIHEFRGIRDLTLKMRGENFVISGPNGSGKSGVVDAIEFALTGEIRRLEGAGTGDIKLSEHGPHVETRSHPDASWVELRVFIPEINTPVSIHRKISKPSQPKITPDDPGVKAVLAHVRAHPEIALSRREIVKFILTPATQRSRDVQTLLKLEDIDQTRATLKTTENKLSAEYSTAKMIADEAEASLLSHLGVPAPLKGADLLAAVNERRRCLQLPVIVELRANTSVTADLMQGAGARGGTQTKESALADLKALAAVAAGGGETALDTAIAVLQRGMGRIAAEPQFFASMRRQSLVQSGYDLLDGAECPLCGVAWDIDALRAHLQTELRKFKEAEKLHAEILASARVLAAASLRARTLVDSVVSLPEASGDAAQLLSAWSGALLSFSQSLSTVESIALQKERLSPQWAAAPDEAAGEIQAITERVTVRPDQGADGEARDFLVLAQERLNRWRVARREAERRRASASRGKTAYKTYCDVAEVILSSLYEDVEADFGTYYRYLNHDDEGEFKAELEPTEGKLALRVDFHGKGMFPPGAYHSEGHQDGMGVCLYLALMKRVLGDAFTVAVLDDVVMSVDRQHRRRFCRLLKAQFPSTQFVITTHDGVWARQIRSEGLIGAKADIAFHTWTVETGPVLDEVAEVWVQIESDLAKGDVPAAAGRLRRHLEYVAAELADQLAAAVRFRADGGYDMGELLNAVIGRQRDILRQAVKAAKSWGNTEQLKRVDALLEERAAILSAKGGEEWVLNKAIHYNDWVDLSREDFEPAVDAFRRLLDQFRCGESKCDSWFYVTPRNDPEELRCGCGAFHLNLREK